MKKVSLFIISILLFALILSSCNLDAQEGIFSKIASSQKDAGIKVMAYLGKTTDCHYVQTDSSVISINATSKEVTTIASSTSDAKIRDACLTTSGDLYVLTTKDGVEDTSIVKYKEAKSESPSPTQVENPKHLLVNGAYVFVENEGEDTETYKIDFLNGSGVEKNLTSAPITILENGDYVFVKCSSTTGSTTTYTYLVYKNDGTGELKKEGITTNTEIRGFQPLSDTSYLLIDDSGNIYSITSSSSDIADTNTDLTSSSLPNGQVYSFSYEDAENTSKTYVVYKTTSYFERLTITTTDGTPSYEVATYKTNGYSTDLRTSTVTNIVPPDDNGKFVIATWTNSVFEVNTSDDSYEDLLN